MHPLLQRQIARVLRKSADAGVVPEELYAIISQTYKDFDRERRLAERASKLMEEELLALNASLEVRVQERTVDLERAKRHAEAAARSKSEFLAMMSHEVRTPLFGILGMIDLAMEHSISAAPREMMQTAQACGRALLVILNDILDLSKLENCKLELEYRDFNLPQLLGEISSTFRVQLSAKDLPLEFAWDESLPEMICGDASRLRQIIFNLIGNAVKFTEQGFIKVSVSRAGSSEHPLLRVEITDSGEGIPEAIQRKLFTPFQQGDSSIHRRKGGTGLGLSICRELVSLMGGSIDFKSTLGVGTTFWFELPLTEASTSSVVAVAPASQRQPTDMNGLRVLVAEDNVLNQRITLRILEKAGCVVALAHNGAEAVHMIQEQPFDLVLMDVHMPILDGGSATQQIRALDHPQKDIVIIGLSANALKGDREHYLALGMNEYLTKPIDRASLLEMVGRMGFQPGK
jgi:signal transduction histidine kinase